ncbi:DUF1730 domain-containing protein, partial [bacterium]|nr:DUF1730 domain-containing protein [bacterium]
MSLSDDVKAAARAIGFDTMKIAAPASPPRASSFPAWLQQGKHGSMMWLARDPERRLHPQNIMPDVRSILLFGRNYHQTLPHHILTDPSRGRIASYAWGRDYHKTLTSRLKKLAVEIERLAGRDIHARRYVDTGPLLEKP